VLQPAKGTGGGAKEEPGQETAVRLKRVNADLDAALHARFKTVCARREQQMAEVIRQLIEDWTKQHE
jgi:ParG